MATHRALEDIFSDGLKLVREALGAEEPASGGRTDPAQARPEVRQALTRRGFIAGSAAGRSEPYCAIIRGRQQLQDQTYLAGHCRRSQLVAEFGPMRHLASDIANEQPHPPPMDYPNLLVFGLFTGLDRSSSPLKVFGPGRRGEMAPVFSLNEGTRK